jgi:hypothetical protein
MKLAPPQGGLSQRPAPARGATRYHIAGGITIPYEVFYWREEKPPDVQGAESDLVEGATRFLRASRYLYTEYSNKELYEGQITLAELREKLSDFDLIVRYRWDALFHNKRERRESVTITYPHIQ